MLIKKATRICMCCGERKSIAKDAKYCEKCSSPNTVLFAASESDNTNSSFYATRQIKPLS